MTSIAVGNRRLLRLAKILDTADALHKKRKEPTYDQHAYIHPCGTPACALGHYAAATPRRWKLKYGIFSELVPYRGDLIGVEASEAEFGIDAKASDEIFGIVGCDNAKTAKQASKYIRAFVARRQKEQRK